MDIVDLDARFKLVKAAGVCLNLQERMQLDIALTALVNSTQCDEVLFWGKIFGQKEDYYIAMCIHFQGKYEFPDKTFYWATTKSFRFS